MSWASRINRKINSNIGSAIATNNSIDNVKSTTINGYRSLHISQLDRHGYGSASLSSAQIIDSIGDGNNEDPFDEGELEWFADV